MGLTVPDLDQAVDFFTRVLGCDLVFRTGPFFDPTGGDWMTRHYAVPARARLETAMLRCGPAMNVELLAWHVPGVLPPSEVAGAPAAVHLAIYVDDLESALTHLAAERGVRVLGGPTTVTGEPNEGTEFVYVRLPWGLHLELVRWPPLMPYCAETTVRLHAPVGPWRPMRPPQP